MLDTVLRSHLAPGPRTGSPFTSLDLDIPDCQRAGVTMSDNPTEGPAVGIAGA